MSRRIYMNSNGLKFGPAGIDVTTATPSTLLFDSTGAPYNGVYLTGRTAGGWSQTSSGIVNGTQYIRTLTVSFGKTFAAIPRVYYAILDPGSNTLTQNYNVNTAVYSASANGYSSGCIITTECDVSTSNMTFKIIANIYPGGAQVSFTPDIYFMVFTT